MKKAILTVSFGTSHLDTLDKTIGAIEKELKKEFPDRRFYRAFTSGMIIRKLREAMQMEIKNVSQSMEQMKQDGIEDVLIQPTHMINGFEYEKMMEQIRLYEKEFPVLTVGKPLLSSTEDYEEAAEIIAEDAKMEEDETLVLMGHGTEHHTNAAYPALDYTFWSRGYQNVVVGTVEGFPEIGTVIQRLEERNAGKLVLMPCMIVAGDHAKNDMAGEEEDSWKSVLEKKGYQVRIRLRGLGEIPGIQKMFVRHAKEAQEK